LARPRPLNLSTDGEPSPPEHGECTGVQVTQIPENERDFQQAQTS
jgi:hypothetical protein